MAADEGGQERSFKVEDRRRFSETGEPRAPESSGEPNSAAEPEETPSEESHSSGSTVDSGQAPHPELTFATFVLSLSTQALAHLGEIPDPIDRSTRVDLEAAREVIDILGMLREKTRGNLGNEESNQLDSALYVLRMKYVDRVQKR